MDSYIGSFIGKIKEKILNPFLGTFVFIWMSGNWEIISTMFSFNRYAPINKRIKIIKTHRSEKNFFILT